MVAEFSPVMANRIELWPVERLRPYERNARVHGEAQVAQLAASIQEFGFTAPILVDSDDGILAGHGRLMAARLVGMTAVPVVVLDHLNAEQRRAYLLADNKLAENAGWDDERLAEELGELLKADWDLGALGFDEDELRRLTDGLDLGEFEQLSQPLAPGTERAELEEQAGLGIGAGLGGDRDEDATDESGEVEERHVFSVSMRWDDREQVLMAVAAAKKTHGLEGTAEALALVCREWLDEREG